MTAIAASSVSLKTMMDGTLRISFDFEPSAAQDAFRLFAAPGTQVAIAALKAGTYLEQQATPEKPKGGELCKWAVLRCKEDEFFKFIQPVYWQYVGDVGPDDFDTRELFCRHAVMVLAECEESRSELDHDPLKAANFHKRVREPFSEYLKGHGALAPARGD